jgi:hypothetical protein
MLIKIIRSIDWREVNSRELCGGLPEVGGDGKALMH